VIRWGLLSTADIGSLVIEANRSSASTRFVAVASREAARSQAYAAKHDLPLAFGSCQELLDSPGVDAVYVALPVALHASWAAAALRAGKHVLCEKPFALEPAEVTEAFDAAGSLVCAEGLMWRYHPQTATALRLVAAGAIGALTHVRAALSVSAPPGDIRRSAALGGGAVGDQGCSCLSALRLFGGEPVRVYRVPDGGPARREAGRWNGCGSGWPGSVGWAASTRPTWPGTARRRSWSRSPMPTGRSPPRSVPRSAHRRCRTSTRCCPMWTPSSSPPRPARTPSW
jgi:xylose dehydrogenase (NAD/NADP)